MGNTQRISQFRGPIFILMLLAPLVFWGFLILTREVAVDDAFITARYARNLANGYGLVYNANERVLGTTTLGWALFIAPIFFLHVSPTVEIQLVQLCGLIFTFSACLVCTFSPLLSSGRQRVVFMMTLFCVPPISGAASMGMETGAVLFATTVLLYSLAFSPNDSRNTLIRILAIIGLLLLRLDTVIVIVAMYLAYSFAPGDTRRKRWNILTALLTAAMTMGFVLGLTYAVYGQPLPQSMMAKTFLNYSVSVGTASGPLMIVESLLFLNFPWPLLLRGLNLSVVWGIIWLVATVLAWHASKFNKPARFILTAALIYVVSYSTFLTIGRANVFPWYAHLPVFLLYSSVLLILSQTSHYFFSNFILVLIMIGVGAMQFLNIRGILLNHATDNNALYTTGTYLREQQADSIMLEPIGYIGYYSESPKIYDLGGLVSPEVFAFRRTGEPGWFAEVVQKFLPQYVVLRYGEVETNIGWNVGQLFASSQQKQWFESTYMLIAVRGNGVGELSRMAIYRILGR